MFKEDLIKKFEELNLSYVLTEMPNVLEIINELYLYKLFPFGNHENKDEIIAYRTILFMQNTLYRTKALLLSWIQSINSKNTLACVLTSRAHFETTGLLSLHYKFLEQYYDKKINFEDLNKKMEQINLGCSSELGLEGTKSPFNVLNSINELDEFVKRDAKENSKIYSRKNFRKIYNVLSEYSHPNSLGLSMGGKTNKINITRFYSELYITDSDIQVSASIKFSLDLYIELFKRMSILINKNKNLPRIER